MRDVRTVALVTGATGSVGPALAQALRAAGTRVRILARGLVPSELINPQVETVYGEIWDRDAVARAMDGTDMVFHLAAKLHIPNPTPEMRSEYERVNVEGTSALVEAAQSAGVERLIVFSTISVYGPTGIEPVDETADTHPETIYAKTKLQAEEVAMSASNDSGEPLSTVLRMAAIYGPRMKGNYVCLANALARGRFLPVGDGANLRTLVYVEDAVQAAILASRSPIAAGRVYNVTDGAVHSMKEIISAICEALGRRPPRLYIPTSMARLAAVVVDRALILGGRFPLFAPAVDKFVESVAVRGDRIQQGLGFRPEYDLRKGWKATIVGEKTGNVRQWR